MIRYISNSEFTISIARAIQAIPDKEVESTGAFVVTTEKGAHAKHILYMFYLEYCDGKNIRPISIYNLEKLTEHDFSRMLKGE